DGRDLAQEPAAESAAFGGEASALVIGQPEASARQLAFEDSVLRHEVLDDVVLVAIDPSGEDHQQHLQGGGGGNHSPILPCPTTDHPWGPRPNIRTIRGKQRTPALWADLAVYALAGVRGEEVGAYRTHLAVLRHGLILRLVLGDLGSLAEETTRRHDHQGQGGRAQDL